MPFPLRLNRGPKGRRPKEGGGIEYRDSGGPAFWIQPDGTRVFVGLTSWGDFKLVATSFYWRVDLPETLDFIQQVIQRLEQ